ncbi:MAG: hypothetical protein AAF085_00275 [Planctomycetota bacterium]
MDDDFADFVLNPMTGDLVALNPQTNHAVVYSGSTLKRGIAKKVAEIKVGLTPVSICYKRYKDMAVYAVACSQVSKVYLIDADKNTVIKQIDTGAAGISKASASLNPDDPFIYINYGSGHDSEAGAISLRDMSYHASVVDDSMDLTVSADGKVIYRRGPWSPSGFESVIMTNSFEDKRPVFTRLYYDHRSVGAYVADPHGQYTATGTKLFSKGLDRSVADLPFTPTTFFTDRPLIMGSDIGDTRRNAPKKAVLRAASYNSFEKIGQEITLELPVPGKDGVLPRGVGGQADFKRVSRQAKLLADERNDQVIFAYRTHAVVIPLADFQLPREPLMTAVLDSGSTFTADKLTRINLAPADKTVKLTISDKPKGMTYIGGALSWKPGMEDIGPAKVMVTLKHGTLEKSQVYEFNVEYPGITLPFQTAGLAADVENERAVIWEALPLDSRGRPTVQAGQTNSLAVIDLDDGKVLAERSLATAITNCTLAGDNVLIWTPNGPTKIEVLERKDLSRKATLITQGSISSLETLGDFVVVKTRQSIEVFDKDKLDKEKVFETNGHSIPRFHGGQQPTAPENGLLVNGILYDEDLKPQWVSQLNNLIRLTGEQGQDIGNARNVGIARPDSNSFSEQFRRQRLPQGMQRLVYTSVPGGQGIISVEYRTVTNQVRGATHTWNTTKELFVSLNTPQGMNQQPLYRKVEHNRNNSSRSQNKPSLTVFEDHAVVVDGNRLYQWEFPEVEAGPGRTAKTMHWDQRQSALAITDASNTTTLEHKIDGGKAPLSFLLQSAYPGVSIDNKTGKVTIDNTALLEHAAKQIATRHARSDRAYYQRMVSSDRANWDKATKAVLDKPARGMPMAMPIQVEASDSDLQTKTLQYQLIVDVPSAMVLKQIDAARAQRAELEKKAAEERAERGEHEERDGPDFGVGRIERPDRAGEGGNREAQLLQRIDKLERRVDLLTRQIELLLLELQQRPSRRDRGDAAEDAAEVSE